MTNSHNTPDKPEAEDQNAAARSPKRKPRTSGKAKREEQLDISRIFSEPIEVSKNGKKSKIPAMEASLRQHLQKALFENNHQSIKMILNEARKYGLIKIPQKLTGGVYIVPKCLPEELQREIFDCDRSNSMYRIWNIVRKYRDELRKNHGKK